MTPRLQQRFDELLQDCISDLPPRLHQLIDQVPIVVLDRPTQEMIRELKAEGVLEADDEALDLCGLHSGVGITERSIEDPTGFGSLDACGAPEQIHLFREGIVELAGGWEDPAADDNVYEEIRITLLHELGHHFGLGETDLDDLGYA